jgi:hypothetical protein
VIPAARLDQLEEVLVVTKITEKMPDAKDLGPLRASDILAERLPTVPTRLKLMPPAMPSQVEQSAPPGTTGGRNWNGSHHCRSSCDSGKEAASQELAGPPNKPAGAATHAAQRRTIGTVNRRRQLRRTVVPGTGYSGNKARSTTQPGEAGAHQITAKLHPPAKRQVKPAPEPTPSAPSEQPSTPPTGAPPQ